MKMSHKLIILFSLLAVLTTAANSAYFYQSSMENLNESTRETLYTLGNRMLIEIEQYVQTMDYALEELTTNVEFMNAFHTVHLQEGTEDIGELVAAQTVMSRLLYQAPIQADFYRVSAYTKGGFYLTNRFEKTDAVVSLSEEAYETVRSLSYLARVDGDPFARHLIGPHNDPWASVHAVPVFSAVRAAIWHGQFIGYLEVSAQVEDLANIFVLHDTQDLMAQAVFDDGTPLFRAFGDDFDPCDLRLNPDGMTHICLEDGTERLVVGLRSKSLGLNILVFQNVSLYNQNARALLMRYATVAGVILLITLAIVILFSLGLTRAIRRLTKKITHLPADNLMAHPEEMLSTMVTSIRDQEIYQLESAFNSLITRLQISHSNEVSLREGTLHAQLSALQMQINPHFVYNTLNIISAKGMECGNEEIIDLCDRFAQMLRYSTDLRAQTATLGEELENAQRYLLLAKARYEDQLQFSIDVPEQIKQLLIPKLTLQPLVENALTHGFSDSAIQRQITITGTEDHQTLHLFIRDNGGGFDAKVLEHLHESFREIEAGRKLEALSPNGHLGLINTYLRLYYYSKGTIRMRLYNDRGAVVCLALPTAREEARP